MLVNEFGNSIDKRLEQFKNAAFPILVTLSGIVIDVSPEQP